MKKIIITILFSLVLSSCGALSMIGLTKTIVTTDLDRRSIGSIADDELIKLELESLVFNDKKFKDSHLNFYLYNKNLLITGEIENNNVRKYLITQIIFKEIVLRIFDETRIAKPSSFTDRGLDSFIDVKVKIAINNQNVFNPVHIGYHTENSIVYLFGDVTKREGKKAGMMVAGVSGVKGVVKHFSYITKIPQKEIDRAIAKENKAKAEELKNKKYFEKQQEINKLQKQMDKIRAE